MILTTLLFLGVPAGQIGALPVSREQQIDALSRSMKSWRGGLKEQGRSEILCDTKRSTGDADLDAIACDTLIRCASPLKDISGRLPADQAARQRFVAAARLDIQQCADRARRDQIGQLVDRRAASTTE